MEDLQKRILEVEQSLWSARKLDSQEVYIQSKIEKGKNLEQVLDHLVLSRESKSYEYQKQTASRFSMVYIFLLMEILRVKNHLVGMGIPQKFSYWEQQQNQMSI